MTTRKHILDALEKVDHQTLTKGKLAQHLQETLGMPEVWEKHVVSYISVPDVQDFVVANLLLEDGTLCKESIEAYPAIGKAWAEGLEEVDRVLSLMENRGYAIVDYCGDLEWHTIEDVFRALTEYGG